MPTYMKKRVLSACGMGVLASGMDDIALEHHDVTARQLNGTTDEMQRCVVLERKENRAWLHAHAHKCIHVEIRVKSLALTSALRVQYACASWLTATSQYSSLVQRFDDTQPQRVVVARRDGPR